MNAAPTPNAADDWSDHAVVEEAPRRRRIPVWVWGCGCGCLLATVLSILLVVWAVRELGGLFDPEKQWERIAEVLPYDERPSNIQPVFALPKIGSWFGIDEGGVSVSILEDETQSLIGVLIEFSGEAGDAVEEIFGGTGGEAEKGLRDQELGTLVIQGRETRFLAGRGESPLPFGGGRDEGAQLWIDLTVEGAEPLAIMLVDVPASSADARETIATEEAEEFLRGFRVWDRP